MINKERLIDEFKKMVSIDSVSFDERRMADYLKAVFEKMGITLYEDNAGEYYGGTSGNLYGCFQGNKSGEPVLFSSHMDTVQPGTGKRAIVQSDGHITSDGTTVLGADDVSGLSAIIEAIRVIKENNLPHRSIEFLFPIAEEFYIKGTNVFDFTRLKAKEAYVLDLTGKIGTAALSAPTLISFDITVTGKAAHAGFAPEDGINSAAVVCEAVSEIKQGRPDEISTLNIGMINGGKGTNIVPECCNVKGELRSMEHQNALKLLDDLKKRFEEKCRKYGAQLKFEHELGIIAYKTEKTSGTVRNFEKVCKSLGINTDYISTFGGSDNNNFARHGIEGIVIACGMNNVHSCSEYSSIADLEKTSEIVLGLMTL